MPELHRHREIRRNTLGGDETRFVTFCDICGSEAVEVCVSAFIDPNNWFLMDDGCVLDNIQETYCPDCAAANGDGTSVPLRQLDRRTGSRNTRWTKEKDWHADPPVFFPGFTLEQRLNEEPV